MTPLRQGFAGQGDVNKAVSLSYASPAIVLPLWRGKQDAVLGGDR